jgi:signal transduction histidine kinase
VILFGWWLERPGSVIWLAAFCSILTALGYVLSPEGGVPWMVLLNRILALCAIWVTAVLVVQARRSEAGIRAAKDKAEASAAVRNAELRVSETRLRDAVEALPVSFAIYDREDRLTLCNDIYRDYLFYHLDSVPLGATFEAIVTDKLRFGHYLEAEGRKDRWLAERLHQHRNPSGPFEQKHSNGRWYWINERRTEEGGVVVVSRDVTDQKRLEGELLRQERLATLGQLTATVSHELRNPLGVIRTSVFIIKDGWTDTNPRVLRALERIDRSVVRCDRIIDELLDFTRTSELDPEPISLDSWLDSALSEQALPSEVELRRNFNMAGIDIAIDRDRIRRAVINVFDNACQAMTDPAIKNDGDVTHILTVTTQALEDRVEIVFEDNGPGIPAEVRPMIFEPLFSTKGFGVGLGLPAVKQIMEQHGGGIDIDSVPGQGARVRLWLPRRSSAPTAG